ncbi:MAG: hypothetical protein QXH26_02525 [Candidatus Hadarchaeales archaeon]
MFRAQENSACKKIAEWFTEKHNKWVENNKLVSWAEKLGIKLNANGELDEEQLFQLFVLAILWNNKPTHKVKTGEKIFREIKSDYTLDNFQRATRDHNVENRLRKIAAETIRNLEVYGLLTLIVNGTLNGKNIWTRIKEILNSPVIGNKQDDLRRWKELSFNLYVSITKHSSP